MEKWANTSRKPAASLMKTGEDADRDLKAAFLAFLSPEPRQ
jgi:hypothetical protein